jgi:hypothetical protein
VKIKNSSITWQAVNRSWNEPKLYLSHNVMTIGEPVCRQARFHVAKTITFKHMKIIHFTLAEKNYLLLQQKTPDIRGFRTNYW